MYIIYDIIYCVSLLSVPFVLYILLFRIHHKNYNRRDWFYLIKWIISKQEIKKHQVKYKKRMEKLGDRFDNEIFTPSHKHIDTQSVCGLDDDGNSLNLKFEIGIDKIAEASLHLRLKDGSTYVFPGDRGSIQTTLPKNCWKIAGLNLEILEPLRKLRITFNGLLKNTSNTDFEKIEHVQFNFIFTSFGSPHYFPQDIDTSLFARALASDYWRDGSWRYNTIKQYGYEQFGVIKGFVRRESHPEKYVLNLPGNRCRSKGISDRFLMSRMLRMIVIDEFGNVFNIITKILTEGKTQFIYGFALLSNERKYPITNIDIQFKDIGEHKSFPDSITTRITVNKKEFKIVAVLRKDKIVRSISETEYGYEYYTVPAECNVNLNKANGNIKFWYKNKGESVFIPKPKLCDKDVNTIPDVLVMDIKAEESHILKLTGGKGNSLALLSSLNSPLFIVPDGFIITIKSYALHVSKNGELVKNISRLNDICCEKTEGDLREICNKVVDLFKNAPIATEVREAILSQLKKYPMESEFFGWAVRSSAIDEDSDELSVAGQNETFLGCQNETDILKNVLACWASLYTYQSVQYRWQHGLPVISDMAVVVQKMVNADASGVLFTWHPTTSNPSQIVVTSNFGLGETVVSGESDPDTFILNRTWDSKICLLDKTLGTKNKVLQTTSVGLVEIIEHEKYKEEWSISDQQAVELGKIGVLLEKAFGNPRDIEWAICKDTIYLLQSRAITTLNTWSDFELSHEMDTPVRTKNSFYTTANIREVIPKAVTVLTHSTSVRCTDRAIQKFAQVNFDPLSEKGLITHQHNILLDVALSIHQNVHSDPHVSGLIMDLAIFGHPVLNEKINEAVKNRLGIASVSKQTKDVSRIMINVWKNIIDRAKKLVDNLDLTIQADDGVVKIYEKINKSLNVIEEVAVCHTKTSGVSVFFQIIAMNIMLEGKSEVTREHISDFASILSSCENVISAEVPKSLEAIAKIINDDEYTKEFCSLNPIEGVSFLKDRCYKAYDLFCQFMDKHGHRSMLEFEMLEPSWKENPGLIISMIQANVKNQKIIHKETENIEDVIKNLKSLQKNSTRRIIKFLIKRIRVAVGCRENTKSEMIRAYDKLRQAYRRLGQAMVHEGLLPSKYLIYHLTHEELGSVIRKRNPNLIRKAIRRQKLYPSWRKLEFPEVMSEIPKPEENDNNIPVDILTGVCKGTSVCTGNVQSRACVIKNLDEIDQLKTGDILITYSTDIGWSPYFPMLSGIITELGGLISHGAVVAREYGLPCIVGVQNATKCFKTGDIVQLNGQKGEIGKI